MKKNNKANGFITFKKKERKLSAEELMLLTYGVGEKDSWESLGLQGDLTSPS